MAKTINTRKDERKKDRMKERNRKEKDRKEERKKERKEKRKKEKGWDTWINNDGRKKILKTIFDF